MSSSIAFNPATMNPAAIILPQINNMNNTNNINNINNDNIWFKLFLLLIFLLIGYILIKRYNMAESAPISKNPNI
jgi:uncharacterized protein with PQ loop repeat